MTNTVFIRLVSNSIFAEIKYDEFDDLCKKLEYMIIQYDSDLLMTLLINNKTLNNFNVINTSILSTLNEHDCILVKYIDKKELYCVYNDNGKYILDTEINDNYSKLLNSIIYSYDNKSYDIIMNNSYNQLVLKAVEQNGNALKYVSSFLQNDKEIVLKSVKQNGESLEYASDTLQKDEEAILAAIEQMKKL